MEAVRPAASGTGSRILPRDFTQETGELTPTLKVKRNVVNETHGDAIEALYSG